MGGIDSDRGLCRADVGGNVEPGLIGMLMFRSSSSRNETDNNPMNEKTTPISGIMGMTSIV